MIISEHIRCYTNLNWSFPRCRGGLWQYLFWSCWTAWGWAHNLGGSAPCWVAGKLQSHLQEKLWKGLWPRAVHMGTLSPLLWSLVVDEIRVLGENGCCILGHAYDSVILTSGKMPNIHWKESSKGPKGTNPFQTEFADESRCQIRWTYSGQEIDMKMWWIRRTGHLDRQRAHF